MTVIICPSCEEQFRVTVQPVDPTKKKTSPGSPITPKVLRAVHAFMRDVGPGRRETVGLWDQFMASEQGEEALGLSVNAFSRALVRNGATRWRDAEKRGVDIPADLPDLPARPARTVQDRIEAQAYQEALVAHTGMTPIHPGEQTFTAAQVKEKGVDIIARLHRERREAAERQQQIDLADLHGEAAR